MKKFVKPKSAYVIVARSVDDNQWEPIDETNKLGEAVRWMKDYEENINEGWQVRIKRQVSPEVYEFMDYK